MEEDGTCHKNERFLLVLRTSVPECGVNDTRGGMGPEHSGPGSFPRFPEMGASGFPALELVCSTGLSEHERPCVICGAT